MSPLVFDKMRPLSTSLNQNRCIGLFAECSYLCTQFCRVSICQLFLFFCFKQICWKSTWRKLQFLSLYEHLYMKKGALCVFYVFFLYQLWFLSGKQVLKREHHIWWYGLFFGIFFKFDTLSEYPSICAFYVVYNNNRLEAPNVRNTFHLTW